MFILTIWLVKYTLQSSNLIKTIPLIPKQHFLDLHLSISNDIVFTKIYDKRVDFDFEIVNFPVLDGDVPRSTPYGVYISQLIRFARASSLLLTSTLAINCYIRNFLNKAISIINVAKHFHNFIHDTMI